MELFQRPPEEDLVKVTVKDPSREHSFLTGYTSGSALKEWLRRPGPMNLVFFPETVFVDGSRFKQGGMKIITAWEVEVLSEARKAEDAKQPTERETPVPSLIEVPSSHKVENLIITLISLCGYRGGRLARPLQSAGLCNWCEQHMLFLYLFTGPDGERRFCSDLCLEQYFDYYPLDPLTQTST